ncbi:hypothetical protein HY478_01065 [Candidatus Uhrbacteria bacterium]|nr:hypothetical protein [Candidatus Uhrbacteria bacterium]
MKNSTFSYPPITKRTVVFYHNDCPDGFAGAWAAWKKMGAKAQYVPLRHQVPLPRVRGKTLYFIDIAPDEKTAKRLLLARNEVIIIDHHVSREKIARSQPIHSFSLSNSGAVLAWQFFHASKTVPQLLRHIEDMDLWALQLPHTKEISLWFMVHNDFTFRTFTKLVRVIASSASRREAIAEGKTIRGYEQKLVRLLADKASAARFEGKRAAVVNGGALKVLSSAVGNELVSRGFPIAIVWSQEGNEMYVSLRSARSTGIDVSKLAVRHGGGGHKAAAGFSFPADKPKPWKTL